MSYVYYACADGGGLLLELLDFVDSCVSGFVTFIA